MFYQTAYQFGLTFDQVRELFPNTSFPANTVLTDGPVRSYRPAPTPSYNTITHSVREVAPVGDVQQWQVYALPAEQVASNQQAAQAALTQQAKDARLDAVSRIKVTTASGKTFDGDETSQTRMARAVVALQAAGQSETTWVLADNTPATVTLAELAEALALAGAEQTRMWVS